uniref:Uncharacterized protein n=1 Tax=Crocodylus porosus TaxID=8502 RepID=A0A7M4FIE3_CROPO
CQPSPAGPCPMYPMPPSPVQTRCLASAMSFFANGDLQGLQHPGGAQEAAEEDRDPAWDPSRGLFWSSSTPGAWVTCNISLTTTRRVTPRLSGKPCCLLSSPLRAAPHCSHFFTLGFNAFLFLTHGYKTVPQAS